MIPLIINSKQLCEIFEPTVDISAWSEAQVLKYSTQQLMYPATVFLLSETYSRDAERTADYELENLTLVNRKAKPEFTWQLIKAVYVERLLAFLSYAYDFKDSSGTIVPRKAEDILIEYQDFTGRRTINAYLGQTIDGTLVEYEGELYWENFRLAFPEK